jgi:hypothetical protein
MKTQSLTLLTDLLRIKIETCTGSSGLLTDLHASFGDAMLPTYYADPGTIQPRLPAPSARLPQNECAAKVTDPNCALVAATVNCREWS